MNNLYRNSKSQRFAVFFLLNFHNKSVNKSKKVLDKTLFVEITTFFKSGFFLAYVFILL